jgi:hypothetical protein
MPTLRTAAKVLLSLTILCAIARPSVADTKSAAREHYLNGERKFDIGKYEEAAAEFEAAYELVGDPVILYNIGKAHQLAQNSERALFFYRTYLRKVEGAPNRAEVQGRINDLQKVLEQSKRASSVPPAGILRSRDLQGGDAATKTEVATHTEPASRPRTDVSIKPRPETPPVTETKPEETPPPPVGEVKPVEPKPEPAPVNLEARRKLLRIVGYSLAGLTVVGVGVGIAFGVLSQNANSAVESASHDTTTQHIWDQAFNDKQNNAHTNDTMQIVGYTISGVAAVGTAVCLYLGFKPEKKPATASISPWASSQGGGFVLSGHF